MSTITRIKTSPVNIDRYMSSELALDETLSAEDKVLLAQFQNLSEHEDHLFSWTCAQMVADEMAVTDSEIILTPYGVTLRSYFQKTVKMTDGLEQVTKSRILHENIRFLRLWVVKTQEMQGQREKINSLTDETRELLDKNVFAVEAIRRVVNLMIEQGFTPTNPEVVNTPMSQALVNGVHIHAENQYKEVREAWLFLPGNKTNVHVTSKNPMMCGRIAQGFAQQVGEILKDISATSIPVASRMEGHTPDGGTGRDPKKYSPAFIRQVKVSKAKQ